MMYVHPAKSIVPTVPSKGTQVTHISSPVQVRFIVMNNLFQTDLHIQRKYDLKGSTQGRFSGKLPSPNTILKDLDLDIRLKLEEGWHERCVQKFPCCWTSLLPSMPGRTCLTEVCDQ